MRLTTAILSVLLTAGIALPGAGDVDRRPDLIVITGAHSDDDTPIIPMVTEADAQAVVKAFVDTCLSSFPVLGREKQAFLNAGFTKETDGPRFSFYHRDSFISGSYGHWLATHMAGNACTISATVANGAEVTRESLEENLPTYVAKAFRPQSEQESARTYSADVRREGEKFTVTIELPGLTSWMNMAGSPVEECGGLPACRIWSPLTLKAEVITWAAYY